MPIIKCPYCGCVWSPRVKEPKYCPKCKRWVLNKTLDITDITDWFHSRQPPIFQRGKYEVFDIPRHCSVCGNVFRRFIRLENRLWCRECIWKLLDESEVGPDVY